MNHRSNSRSGLGLCVALVFFLVGLVFIFSSLPHTDDLMIERRVNSVVARKSQALAGGWELNARETVLEPEARAAILPHEDEGVLSYRVAFDVAGAKWVFGKSKGDRSEVESLVGQINAFLGDPQQRRFEYRQKTFWWFMMPVGLAGGVSGQCRALVFAEEESVKPTTGVKLADALSGRSSDRLRRCLLGLMSFAAFTVHAELPLVIAHRGASGYLPEHTLAAKAAAHAMGADYLEQDLVLSKDDVPVVLHDIFVDTVTDVAVKFPERERADGRYYVLDFTLAELKQLSVSERFNPKTGLAVFPNRFPVRQGAFQIATLEEELQLIQGLNRSTGKHVGIYPEIKSPAWHRREGHDLSKIVLAVLERYGYRTKHDAVYLQCFEFEETKRFRHELGYSGRLIQLLGSGARDAQLRSAEGLKEIAQVADGIGPAISDVVVGQTNGAYQVTDLVERAHAMKLVVHPYTLRADDLPKYVHSLDDMQRILLVEARADGVFTDFPDRTAAFVRSPANRFSKRAPSPQLRAHAHNDYEHPRPLLDALDAGFCSIEADVWLVDGQLLVAHDRQDVKPGRTLQALYLDPLRERIRAHGGRVFVEVPTVSLLIDIKSEAAATYGVLRQVLAEYQELLSQYSFTNTTPRALTVILSGNRPTELVAAESVRHVALDGRLAELEATVSPQLVPLVSDNWKQLFRWRGQGAFPDDERLKLQRLVQRVHQQGKRIRFWGAPDELAGWQELKLAGVDVIGTDDLSGLAQFLSRTE